MTGLFPALPAEPRKPHIRRESASLFSYRVVWVVYPHRKAKMPATRHLDLPRALESAAALWRAEVARTTRAPTFASPPSEG